MGPRNGSDAISAKGTGSGGGSSTSLSTGVDGLDARGAAAGALDTSGSTPTGSVVDAGSVRDDGCSRAGGSGLDAGSVLDAASVRGIGASPSTDGVEPSPIAAAGASPSFPAVFDRRRPASAGA
jgi:hypothetical protein